MKDFKKRYNFAKEVYRKETIETFKGNWVSKLFSTPSTKTGVVLDNYDNLSKIATILGGLRNGKH